MAGAFRVAADSLAISGAEVRGWSNLGKYVFDLTPYLAQSKILYLKLGHGPKGGEGASLRSVAVYRVPEGSQSRAVDYSKPRPDQASVILKNPGFEDAAGDVATAWLADEGHYSVDATVAHSGRSSIRFSNPKSDPEFKAYALQTVELAQDAPRPIRVSAWSKAAGVTGAPDKQYSLWMDAEFVGGKPWWGPALLPFATGTHDWEYREAAIMPKQPLRYLFFHTVFRTHGGTVWFDDVALHEYRGWKPGDPIPKREHFLYGELPCDKPLARQETPYYVVADVTIPAGKTLVIEPGVEIVFDRDYALTVAGEIRAEGTEAQPIRFAAGEVNSEQGSRPAKAEIRFAAGGGKNSVFEHCVFQGVAAPTR
jgi:hypothetical protein